MLETLKQRVCDANLALKDEGLVFLTWGNASARDRDAGLVAIKPSGVAYDALQPDLIPLLNLDGQVVEGAARPSVDAATHLALYRAFPDVDAVIHTHSQYATAFAQARRELPCLGTTHADYFHGPVPLVQPPTPEEARQNYEEHTGMLIAQCFQTRDPLRVPAALVAGHGPFVWGESIEQALENALVLEALARMALHTLALSPQAEPLEAHLLDLHYFRKHGRNAYYGQSSPHNTVP